MQCSIKNKILLIISILFLFGSCKTLPKNPEAIDFIPESFDFIKQEKNIALCSVSLPDIPLIYHIIKVEITPNTTFCTYNACTNNGKSIFPEEFVKSSGATVVINTMPYDKNKETMGLHLEDGKILSAASSKYCALSFSGFPINPEVMIFENQNDPKLKTSNLAIGGYYVILQNFEKKTFRAHSFDSRTAAGITEDGKTLYILCVEGEQKWKSMGLGFQDCADIFMALGCKDAMEFDGGGSTCLFINGKNILTYKKTRKGSAFLGLN